MDPAALDPVHQRSAKRGPFLPQRRDRLGDLDRGGQVFLDQGGEPRGVLLGDLDAPRHAVPRLLKIQLNSMRTANTRHLQVLTNSAHARVWRPGLWTGLEWMSPKRNVVENCPAPSATVSNIIIKQERC